MPKKPLSKTEFVRSLPRTLPAPQVVEKAKESGLTLTAQYVYKVRSLAKSAKATGRDPSKKSSRQRAASGKRAKAIPSSVRESETLFRKYVIQLGIQRSKALLKEIERKLRAVVAK